MNKLNMTDEDWIQYLESETGLEWANNIYDAAFNGAIDPLKAFTMMHRLKSCIELNMKAIQDNAVAEAAKHDGKSFEFNGYEITKKAAAGRWDFKHLPDWNEKKNELSAVEDKHKMAFQMAERGDKYVTEDGEVVEPASYTPGADTISLKPLK